MYIYSHFHDDMIRLAKSRLKNAGYCNYELEAEEVVQESFIKIIKYIDTKKQFMRRGK